MWLAGLILGCVAGAFSHEGMYIKAMLVSLPVFGYALLRIRFLSLP